MFRLRGVVIEEPETLVRACRQGQQPRAGQVRGLLVRRDHVAGKRVPAEFRQPRLARLAVAHGGALHRAQAIEKERGFEVAFEGLEASVEIAVVGLGRFHAAVMMVVEHAEAREVAAGHAVLFSFGENPRAPVLHGHQFAVAQRGDYLGELPVVGAIVGPLDGFLGGGIFLFQIVLIAQFPMGDLWESVDHIRDLPRPGAVRAVRPAGFPACPTPAA